MQPIKATAICLLSCDAAAVSKPPCAHGMELPGAQKLSIPQLDGGSMQPQWKLCVCPACGNLWHVQPLCSRLSLLAALWCCWSLAPLTVKLLLLGAINSRLQQACGIYVPHAEPAGRSNLWRGKSHSQPHLLMRCVAVYWPRPASSIPLPAHRHAVQEPVWLSL